MKLFTYFRSSAAYRQKPHPALQTDNGVLTQSLAIIEWLDETCPQVLLLPADADSRALND